MLSSCRCGSVVMPGISRVAHIDQALLNGITVFIFHRPFEFLRERRRNSLRTGLDLDRRRLDAIGKPASIAGLMIEQRHARAVHRDFDLLALALILARTADRSWRIVEATA